MKDQDWMQARALKSMFHGEDSWPSSKANYPKTPLQVHSNGAHE